MHDKQPVRSTLNPPAQGERPGLQRRFLCILADVLILWLPMTVIWGPLAYTEIASVLIACLGPGPGVVLSPASLRDIGLTYMLDFALTAGYFGITQGKWGQTLGKRLGREKIVRLDGSSLQMSTGILRGGGLLRHARCDFRGRYYPKLWTGKGWSYCQTLSYVKCCGLGRSGGKFLAPFTSATPDKTSGSIGNCGA